MSSSRIPFAEALRSLAEALRSRSFRRYSVALFLQTAGRWAHEIAVLWLVYQITGTALSVGFAVAIAAVAQAALVPLAGMLLDRVNRRLLMSAIHTVKAVMVGVLAVAVFAEGTDISLWLLYAVIAALGVISAIDRPLRKAFVRDVVSASGLESATRLFTPLSSVGRISGSMLAALLLSLSMPWICFALNSAAAVVTTLLVLSMPQSVGVISATQRMARGWILDYLKYTPAVTVPLLLLICFSLLCFNIPVIAQPLADTQLQAGAGAFGMLMTALSVGRFCGSVAVVALGHSKPGTVGVLLVIAGLTLTPLAAVGDIYVALAAFWLAGAALGGFHSFVNSAIQVAVDPRLQGRITVLYSTSTSWFRAAGALLMSWLTDTLGTRTTLVAAGVATVCFAGVTLVWLSRRSPSP